MDYPDCDRRSSHEAPEGSTPHVRVSGRGWQRRRARGLNRDFADWHDLPSEALENAPLREILTMALAPGFLRLLSFPPTWTPVLHSSLAAHLTGADRDRRRHVTKIAMLVLAAVAPGRFLARPHTARCRPSSATRITTLNLVNAACSVS